MIYFKIVKSYVPFEYDLFVYVVFFLIKEEAHSCFLFLKWSSMYQLRKICELII